MKQRSPFRSIVRLLAVVVVTACGGSIVVGWLLPQSRHTSPKPLPVELGAEMVTLALPDVGRLAALYVPAHGPTPESRGALLLLHGLGGSKNFELHRARFLQAAGWSTLCLDLPGHGQSDGNAITFGPCESAAAQVALAWLREREPGRPLGAIGSSLGGAALALADPPLPVEVMVLEAAFSSLHDAFEARMRVLSGPLATPVLWLTPLFELGFRLRTGVDPETVRPSDHVAHCAAPGCVFLVMHGDADRETPIDQGRALFAALPEPKQFWSVPGAAHEDLHLFAPLDYERRLLAFLDEYLR